MMPESLDSITQRINAFVKARDWERFHDPKNLSMALASEIGELCAILRWANNADADAFALARKRELAEEIGDIGILLLRLCERLEIDFAMAVSVKLEMNESRYPVDIAMGEPERPHKKAR